MASFERLRRAQAKKPIWRALVDQRPTYAYRRIIALLNRERALSAGPNVNHKRVFRIMQRHELRCHWRKEVPHEIAYDSKRGFRMKTRSFNCEKCPGFCCSYDVINVSEQDIARIADHLGISADEVIVRFTKYGAYHGDSRRPVLMKHKHDRHFGTICTFFDQEKWRCKIYIARPDTCRAYPHGKTCGYFEFLTFERKLQRNEAHVAVTR